MINEINNNDMGDKILTAIARFFSATFSPLLMPGYGVLVALWASVLCYLPSGTRLVVLMVVMGITGILPMMLIAVLYNTKAINDKRLIKRRERHIPYVFSVLCYVATAFYLSTVHAPVWLIAYMGGCAVASAVCMITNIKWKISAHLAGMAGLLALVLYLHSQGLGAFNLFPLVCFNILLCGLIGTSRLILERNTFWQVLAGAVAGFVIIGASMNLFG